MFGTLAQEIEALAIPVDGEALAEVLALASQLRAKITEAVGAFDTACLWDLDAATTTIAWLRDFGRLSQREAVRLTMQARRLQRLPALAAAFADGRLSASQIDVVLACVPPGLAELFETQHAELVDSLASLSVNDTLRAMRAWKACAEAVADGPEDDPSDPEPAEPVRELHLSQTWGAQWVIDGEVDPVGGEVVSTALRLAESSDTPDDPFRTFAQRRADALVDLCQFFLDHQTARAGGRHRPHLNVVIDIEALDGGRAGHAIDGTPIDSPTIGMLLCDCAFHRVVTQGGSSILDYGRSTRTAPPNLFNALLVRDEHCRFGDCDRPGHWVDAHHVPGWEHGGQTRIDQMVLLCRKHHRRLHQRRWRAKLLPDATFVVTDPSGREIASYAPRQQRALLVT